MFPPPPLISQRPTSGVPIRPSSRVGGRLFLSFCRTLLPLPCEPALHQALRSQFGSASESAIVPCRAASRLARLQQPSHIGSHLSWPRHTTLQTKLTLHETRQHLAPRLQQWVSNDNLHESLQALPAMLNHVVTEAIGKDLARQRRDRDPRALTLQDVAEVLEIRVTTSDRGLAQLEGGDVGLAKNLIVRIHGATHAVSLRVFDLGFRQRLVNMHRWAPSAMREEVGQERWPYFDLEEVLWRPIDLLERLLARIGRCLHDGGVGGALRTRVSV